MGFAGARGLRPRHRVRAVGGILKHISRAVAPGAGVRTQVGDGLEAEACLAIHRSFSY